MKALSPCDSWRCGCRSRRYIARGELLLALLLPVLSPGAETLNYAEGADPSDDPAATDGIPAGRRRYVDDVTGSDANDGKSPQGAWKTLAPVNDNAASFEPGTYVLFKRGQSFRGTLTIGSCQGSPGRRIVFGVYGPGHSNGDGDPFNDLRPRLVGDSTPIDARNAATISLGAARWVMLRDLDTGKMMGSPADTVIYNNVAHGSGATSNVVRLSNNATRCAIVQNLIYDCAANDLISIHSGQATPPASVGPSHWIVDNVIVGNSGAESGIDLQVGAERFKEPVSDDFKVIGNRVQMQAGTVPGLSQRHSGRGTAGIEGGHLGRHVWIMGNMVTGAAKRGLKQGGLKQYVQISGNLFWRNGAESNSAECATDDTYFEHNTIIHTASGQDVLNLKNQITQTGFRYDALRWMLTRNLLVRMNGGSWFKTWSAGPDAIVRMDWNWYGGNVSGTLNGVALADWQNTTKYDRNSFSGDVPGVSLPSTKPTDENPKNWYSAAFLDYFTPTTGWTGDALGDGTPAGALKSDGSWHGGGPWGAGIWNPNAMRAFPTLAINGGYGWEGPLLVQHRYPLPTARMTERWELMAEENFASVAALARFRPEGSADLSVTDQGALLIHTKPGRIEGEETDDSVVWFEQPFAGDIRIEFDAKAEAGNRCIFFFNARPRGNYKSLFKWRRPLAHYESYAGDERIDLYSIGILRSDEKAVNLRYLGGKESAASLKERLALPRGEPRRKALNDRFEKLTILQDVSSPFGDADKVYHFDVRVVGPHVTVLVDGKTLFDFADKARKDRPLTGGYFGFRNFHPVRAWFDNLRVYRAVRR